MPVTLTAVQCPNPIAFSGVYDPADGPLTAPTFSTGETTTVTPKLLEVGGRIDLAGRFGGGVYGIVHGLTISAGSGLTLNISAGQAMIDGAVTKESAFTYLLPDLSGGRAYVWLSRTGPVTHTTNLTPPAGAYAFLGSAVTNAAAISSVDHSGIMEIKGGIPRRQTADATTPSDTPPAQLVHFVQGPIKLWFWDGANYREVAGATPGAPYGQLVKTPAAGGPTISLTAAEVQRYSEIDLQTGGGVNQRFFVEFPTSGTTAGGAWIVRNQTGYPCTVKLQGGTSTRYLGDGATKLFVYDGSEMREAGWGNPSFHTESQSSSPWSPTDFDEVDYQFFQILAASGNLTVNVPGTLSHRGFHHVVKAGDSNSNLVTVKPSGGSASEETAMLPGESQLFHLDTAGSHKRSVSRPYHQLAAVTHDDAASYTVPVAAAQHFILTVGGTLTAARNLVLPTCKDKEWLVKNNTGGGFALTVKTSGGAGVVIASGKIARVYCDGTDILIGSPQCETRLAAYQAFLAFGQTATGQVANTGTETTLTAAGLGTRTIPANWLAPGRSVRLTARGILSTDAVPGTLEIKFKLGSTTVVTTGAQTPTAALTNRLWECSVILTCRTVGATGTVIAQGDFDHAPGAALAAIRWEMLSTTTTTIDTTAAQTVDLTADWQTADTDNDIRDTNLLLELLG